MFKKLFQVITLALLINLNPFGKSCQAFDCAGYGTYQECHKACANECSHDIIQGYKVCTFRCMMDHCVGTDKCPDYKPGISKVFDCAGEVTAQACSDHCFTNCSAGYGSGTPGAANCNIQCCLDHCTDCPGYSPNICNIKQTQRKRSIHK